MEDEWPEHNLTRLGLGLMRAAILHKLADWVRASQAELLLLLHREDKEFILETPIELVRAISFGEEPDLDQWIEWVKAGRD